MLGKQINVPVKASPPPLLHLPKQCQYEELPKLSNQLYPVRLTLVIVVGRSKQDCILQYSW